jgi:hypothetical protein
MIKIALCFIYLTPNFIVFTSVVVCLLCFFNDVYRLLLDLGAFGHIVPSGNTSHFVCTFTTGGCYEVHHCGITQTTHFIKDFTTIGSGTDVRQLKFQGIELKGQSKPLRFSKTLLTN